MNMIAQDFSKILYKLLAFFLLNYVTNIFKVERNTKLSFSIANILAVEN